MDLLHHIYTLILDGELHMAPIKSHPERVLDLGTGTGIWAMDFAEYVLLLELLLELDFAHMIRDYSQYKSAEVLGMLLFAYQGSLIDQHRKRSQSHSTKLVRITSSMSTK